MGVISRPVRAGTVAIMGLAITAFTGTLASAGAATPAPGANLGYVALANSVPPTTDNVTGSYSSSKMQIEVAVAPRDEAGLNTMLAALYDKNSPSYHRWLSTGQFDARYAPTPATQSAVAKYLSTSGLTVVPSGSPFLVRATGSSAQIQRTFHTTLNSFKNPQGTKYFANSTPVYVPGSLAGTAMGVIGLTNTQRNAKNTKNVPHFNNTMRPGAKASATTNCETSYPTVAQLFSHRVDAQSPDPGLRRRPRLQRPDPVPGELALRRAQPRPAGQGQGRRHRGVRALGLPALRHRHLGAPVLRARATPRRWST